MGYDELAPLSLRGTDKFGGLGAMVIDSLDTLYMFGLQEEFKR
jgi:mannosyl-oligosaccharide alpha-1,2-mannosidase